MILISHQHSDHFNLESLKKILANNPNAIIITNDGVGKELKEAGIQYEVLKDKTSKDFENFKNAAQLQYQAATSGFTTALADEVISQKTLDLSKKIFVTNQAKYKQGAGSSFELEQSEQEFTTNQLKHIQSIMNLLNAKADLDKAMGVK